MSIDKQEEDGDKTPSPSYIYGRRVKLALRQIMWFLVLAPLFLLPILAVGSVIWGVCLRILVELFNWSYNLFGF